MKAHPRCHIFCPDRLSSHRRLDNTPCVAGHPSFRWPSLGLETENRAIILLILKSASHVASATRCTRNADAWLMKDRLAGVPERCILDLHCFPESCRLPVDDMSSRKPPALTKALSIRGA